MNPGNSVISGLIFALRIRWTTWMPRTGRTSPPLLNEADRIIEEQGDELDRLTGMLVRRANG